MTGNALETSGLDIKNVPKDYLQFLEKIREDAKNARPYLGWVALPFQPEHLKACLKWKARVPTSQTTLVVLGIGGSCLGAKAAYDFILPKKDVLFLDNVDGFGFEKAIGQLNLRKSHFLVISKSGETFETLFQLAHIMQVLSKKKLKFRNHISAISEDNQGKLRQIVKEHDLSFLSMPKDVGGRFSVLSSVGLAPLVWAGVDGKKLLEGARFAAGQDELIAAVTRFYAESFVRGEWVTIFWNYAEGLKTFGLWIEQLWAESLGKKKDRKGKEAPRASTPVSCVGATDQHSLLQQFTEGARDKSFTFLRCLESERSQKISKVHSQALLMAKGHSVGELLRIESQATRKILSDLGVATCELVVKDHSPFCMGALLYLYEMIVACLGEWLDINAFDQPGVEGVKKVIRSELGMGH